MPRLRIELVGGVRVRAHDGTEIPISARKCQALLGCLALRPGVPLPRDFLASLLWDAADQELARSSLRQALAALRRVLPPDTLRADAKAVWLDEKLVTSDVRELHELARDESPGALLGSIDRYGDELFGAIEVHSLAFDHWARDQRQQFRRQLVDGLERVAAHCTAAGDLTGLLECARAAGPSRALQRTCAPRSDVRARAARPSHGRAAPVPPLPGGVAA